MDQPDTAGEAHGKVMRLVPKPVPPPAQEALDMLRTTIARVESGEITAVAIVARTRDDGISTAWHGWAGDLIAPTQMLAARLIDSVRGW